MPPCCAFIEGKQSMRSYTSAMLGSKGGARCCALPSGGQLFCMHHIVAYLSNMHLQWPACNSSALLCLPAGGNRQQQQSVETGNWIPCSDISLCWRSMLRCIQLELGPSCGELVCGLHMLHSVSPTTVYL